MMESQRLKLDHPSIQNLGFNILDFLSKNKSEKGERNAFKKALKLLMKMTGTKQVKGSLNKKSVNMPFIFSNVNRFSNLKSLNIKSIDMPLITMLSLETFMESCRILLKLLIYL